MNTEMNSSIPVEVSEKRLSLLHSRLFPEGALDSVAAGSPQRIIIHSSIKMEKDCNSVSKLEDFSSPNKQGFPTTPNSSRSRSNLDLAGMDENENSREKAILGSKDAESGLKRQRDSETNEEQPVMKSPTLKAIEDQNGLLSLPLMNAFNKF